MSALPGISDINLFRYCQCIVHFNAQISDRAFNLRMSKQKLHGPEISRPAIDQGSFRASQRMRPEQPRVQPDASDPFRNEARILPGAHAVRASAAARTLE